MWSLLKKNLKKKMSKQSQGKNKFFEDSNVYDLLCFLFANAITVLTVDFEMAFWGTRSGWKQTILILFSSSFYSVTWWRKAPCLTGEFHVKFHLKNRYRRNREARKQAKSYFPASEKVLFPSHPHHKQFWSSLYFISVCNLFLIPRTLFQCIHRIPLI